MDFVTNTGGGIAAGVLRALAPEDGHALRVAQAMQAQAYGEFALVVGRGIAMLGRYDTTGASLRIAEVDGEMMHALGFDCQAGRVDIRSDLGFETLAKPGAAVDRLVELVREIAPGLRPEGPRP